MKQLFTAIIMLGFLATGYSQKISFQTLVYDYGTIALGSDGTCSFFFKNTGTGYLHISSVRSSCGCLVPKWPKIGTAPGNTGVINAKYDTQRIGPFSKTVTVTSNGSGEAIRLQVKGIVSNDGVTRSSASSTNTNIEIFTDDRDNGTKYKWFNIGTQIWMAENLNYKTNSGSWCYDNNSSNCDIYGRLYNWETAKTACPNGWHLPSDDEWKTLEMALGTSKSGADLKDWRGTNQGDQLKEVGTSHWRSVNNGTNSSGFCALPGGGRYNDSFNYIEETGWWWSSSEKSSESWGASSGNSWARGLSYDKSEVYRGYTDSQNNGFSVRCVNDKSNYDVVKKDESAQNSAFDKSKLESDRLIVANNATNISSSQKVKIKKNKKLCDSYGNCGRYTGPIVSRKANGYGTIVYDSGKKYVGEFVNNEPTGRGKYTMRLCDAFGNCGTYNGPGTYYLANGHGTLVYNNGDVYDGGFKDNSQHGQGTWTKSNGDKYIGSFRVGKKHGHGVFIWANGSKIEGDFVNNKREGEFIQTTKNGEKTIIVYKNDKDIDRKSFDPIKALSAAVKVTEVVVKTVAELLPDDVRRAIAEGSSSSSSSSSDCVLKIEQTNESGMCGDCYPKKIKVKCKTKLGNEYMFYWSGSDNCGCFQMPNKTGYWKPSFTYGFDRFLGTTEAKAAKKLCECE